MIRYLTTLALALCALAVGAQPVAQVPLTAAQLTTVRTFACADLVTARPMVLAGDSAALRIWLNTDGGYIVWRTKVTNDELGDAMAGTELDNLSSLKLQLLQALAAYSGGNQNMSRADRRAAFNGAFAGLNGTITRPAIAAISKRAALRVGQALATGAGTTASPGTLTYEGTIRETDVARMLFTDSGQPLGC